MSLVRLIARPMLATVFVVQGANNLRNPDAGVPGATKFAERFGPTIERRAPSFPTDPKTLVRINAGVQLTAGLALGTGRFPRLAALTLAASLVPTTWAGHAFWEIDDPAQRKTQRVQAMKNVGLTGGLLLAGVDTGGKPGLTWRARHAARDARRAGKGAKREAKLTARKARNEITSMPHRGKS
ncbi:putative membrane protein YphA (DoxX/SURF4 family) [Haloactinopolyspora alba]|uniref:Putative membrane protein YphA (DoxX/SURF4 family) n=1 Tax=Haloactinopolyspora alba TaxID=648780 RepID=A0A2P8EB13_9ACTN|nr:DoxX family protein [Haloactinopolyspora alba]PSL06648.1 putative membrane protein YphA (DoxX/SURF4 family) [Haloactinopolyspora alba]